MSELEPFDQLPEPATGELLPATPGNAARIRLAAADVIARMRSLQYECDRVLAEEAIRLGTKTLHLDGRTVTLTGGITTEYDEHELMAGLMECGCPPERINAAVTEIVSYKVNRSVLRQLAAANPNYADAIDLATRRTEKPWRAAISQ